MKVTVTKYLNVRVGEPSVNAPNYHYLAPGTILEVDGQLYEGEPYDGITTWYKDAAGNYYWSGGFAESELPTTATTRFDSNKFWWIKEFQIEQLWRITPSTPKIKVAVLDAGLSLPHPDLIINSASIFNVNAVQSLEDWSGHGTHVSGIIKASHNQFGIHGIAPEVDFFFAKVTNDITGDSPEDLAKGVEWAIQQKVDIISVSMGFQQDNSRLKKAIEAAVKQKILVVCAAGNKIDHTHVNIDYPARYSDVLAVGGLKNSRKQLADTVNAKQTHLFAPGFNIVSTSRNKGYDTLSGSSQAAAFVTGVAAVLLDVKRDSEPSYEAIKIKDHLIATGDQESFGTVLNPLQSLNNLP